VHPIVTADEAEHQWLKGLVDRIQFRGDEHVLDVGCGDGFVCNYVATTKLHKGRVLAVDTEDNLRRAQQRSAENITFKAGDALTLKSAISSDQKFDIVVSYSHLHQLGYKLEDHLLALSNIISVLKPGGRFFFSLLVSLPPRLQEEVHVLARGERSKWRKYFNDFDISPWWSQNSLQKSLGEDPHKAYYNLLKATKLHPLLVQRSDNFVHLPDEKNLVHFMGYILGTESKRIPEERRSSYLQQLIDLMHKKGFVGHRLKGKQYTVKCHHIQGEALLI
jgi:trans-aconitate methyltransferase